MTEAYLHIASLPGRCPNDPALLPREGEGEHVMDGMLLLVSTSSRRLGDYIVLHSPEELTWGHEERGEQRALHGTSQISIDAFLCL